MAKNVASSVVVSVLLVAAAMAVVNSNHDKRGGGRSSGGHLHTTLKASDYSIDALCGYTDYPDACKRVLASVTSPTNTTDVLQTAGDAAMQEIRGVLARSDEISKAISDPNNKEAMQSCKNFLGYAIDDLRAVIMEVHNIQTMSFDLKNWMTGVAAKASICIDELDVAPDLRSQMHNFMGNATELMSNALALLNGLSEVAELGGSGRSLREDGYPEWMAAPDRKLLASANNAGAKPNLVVAQDGSGDAKTIMEAINKVPKKSPNRFTIYVKSGVYKEKVVIPSSVQNVFMYGDGPKNTKVTGSLHNPVSTSETATFAVIGTGFICKGMGFENTAGASGHQAVALRVQSDKSAFFNCRMDAYQDTLYYQTNLQFYSNCVISGTVDFIFGKGAAVLQNCLIIVRKPLDNQFNTITADGREDSHWHSGLVLHNCRIVPETALMATRLTTKTYYGRPWKKFARTVVMESMVGDLLRPEGWMEWQGESFHQSCFYAEYSNTGPGAVTDGRVAWAKKTLDRNIAVQFTVDKFLQGSAWVVATGAKVVTGLNK